MKMLLIKAKVFWIQRCLYPFLYLCIRYTRSQVYKLWKRIERQNPEHFSVDEKYAPLRFGQIRSLIAPLKDLENWCFQHTTSSRNRKCYMQPEKSYQSSYTDSLSDWDMFLDRL
nr:MAG TPA: hypothetical protein [Caudoviricetes sp.]